MWLIGNNNPKHAFTFVELMLTVVILTAGLILIIQGFITVTDALNTANNYIRATQFLDTKMQETEAQAKKDNGVKIDETKGEFSYGGRNFNWELTIVAVEKDEEELDLSKDLNKVSLKVSWQQKNSPKDLTIATYLKNRQE